MLWLSRSGCTIYGDSPIHDLSESNHTRRSRGRGAKFFEEPEHYAENVTVDQLANIAHYSSAQFRRLFRKLTQMSPSDYIANVRVNAAKTLLGTTDRRISDIASDVGFFDHAHLIRIFKRVVGTTPARYRRNTMGLHRHH